MEKLAEVFKNFPRRLGDKDHVARRKVGKKSIGVEGVDCDPLTVLADDPSLVGFGGAVHQVGVNTFLKVFFILQAKEWVTLDYAFCHDKEPHLGQM